MKSLVVYNTEGEKKGTMKIPEILDVAVNPVLIQQAVVAQQSNLLHPTAITKTRGKVRGGGRKPWRQKGTGRARAGSIRSPLWRGGGIIFGPTEVRNFTKKINKKQKRKAILGALSAKIKDNKVFILENLAIPEIKTKNMLKILEKLPIEGSSLLLIEKPDEKIQKSARNIPFIKINLAHNLNVVDLLKYDFIVITKDAMKKVI